MTKYETYGFSLDFCLIDWTTDNICAHFTFISSFHTSFSYSSASIHIGSSITSVGNPFFCHANIRRPRMPHSRTRNHHHQLLWNERGKGSERGRWGTWKCFIVNYSYFIWGWIWQILLLLLFYGYTLCRLGPHSPVLHLRFVCALLPCAKIVFNHSFLVHSIFSSLPLPPFFHICYLPLLLCLAFDLKPFGPMCTMLQNFFPFLSIMLGLQLYWRPISSFIVSGNGNVSNFFRC